MVIQGTALLHWLQTQKLQVCVLRVSSGPQNLLWWQPNDKFQVWEQHRANWWLSSKWCHLVFYVVSETNNACYVMEKTKICLSNTSENSFLFVSGETGKCKNNKLWFYVVDDEENFLDQGSGHSLVIHEIILHMWQFSKTDVLVGLQIHVFSAFMLS